MSISLDVILDPAVMLPDGRSSKGCFRTWEFGGIWKMRYRIDAEGRLWQEWKPDLDAGKGGGTERIPLHGFFTFEVADAGQHCYTARFTYGLLHGIMVGDASVWNEVHGKDG
jgi:hypothetical protein